MIRQKIKGKIKKMLGVFFRKNKTEIIIFLGVFLVYSFFTALKITHGSFGAIIRAGATDYYFDIANNLAKHNIFGLDDLKPTALRMPIYPVFLALIFKIFGTWWAVFFVQNAIAGLSAVFLYLIARKWLTQTWAIAVSLVWVFTPYSMDVASQFLTETLYEFFLILAVYFFIEYKDKIRPMIFAASLAFLLAILIYIKPISLLLPIVFALAINYPRPAKTKIYQTAALLAVFAILLFPWLLRNYLIFGTWQLSSDNSSSLYATAMFFEAKKQGLESVNRDKPEKSEFGRFAESGNLIKTPSQFKSAVKIIMSDPLNFTKFYLEYALKNFGSSWWGSLKNLIYGTMGTVNYHPTVTRAIWHFDWLTILKFSAKEIIAFIVMFLGIAFWCLMFIFGAIGAIKFYRQADAANRAFLILLIAVSFYFLFVGNLATGDAIRYRFPATPFIILLAVYGINSILCEQNSSL